MFHHRLLGGLSAVALLGSPMPVAAALSEIANRNAYEYAIRCFAVTALAKERGMETDDGVKAYDMAQTLGARLGMSEKQTDSDIRTRTARELEAFVHNSAYLDRTLSDCHRLRLL